MMKTVAARREISKGPNRMYLPSPLFEWKLILVAVIVALLIMFRFDPDEFFMDRTTKVFEGRLESHRFQEDEFGVLFFGNSLLRSALPGSDDRISDALRDELVRQGRHNHRLRAINFAIGGRSGRDLERFRREILRIRPSVVVIQAEMIVSRYPDEVAPKPDRERFSRWDRIQRWSDALRAPLVRYLPAAELPRVRDRRLLNALGLQAHVDIRPLRKEMEEEKGKDEEELPAPEGLRNPAPLWRNQMVSQNSAEYRAVRSFLQSARAQGIRVIVVEVPVSATAASVAPDRYLKRRSALLRKLTESAGGFHLRYPEVLPDNCFRDYSHTNMKGRRKFFLWFAPAFARVLAAEE